MPAVIVVGAQWGDEGKGKVVDLFAEKADMVARFAGGANAGHTLVAGGKKLVTHLVPSGVMHPGTKCVLGDGMVIDPLVLVEEIQECRRLGFLAPGDLLIGEGAHVIVPYHALLEKLREGQRKHAIGTTGRGIGPAYEAKMGRRGIRVGDLASRARVAELVAANVAEIAPLIRHMGGTCPSAVEQTNWIDALVRAGESFADCVTDVGPLVCAAIDQGQNVLLEGAQGALLDVDHGTYPFVTSSSTIAAGACQGLGIGPTKIDAVVGITKAYCTRVGSGPFPSEMRGDEADQWRIAGQEFGATTGRPRRCGWLDLPALRRAVRVNGMSSLAVTKLDVMAGRGNIRVCVGYRDQNGTMSEMPRELTAEIEPIYEERPGWSELCDAAKTVADLPKPAQDYLQWLENRLEVPICLVSVGPGRDETLVLSDVFA